MSLHRAAAIPAEFTFPGSCYAENHQGLSRQGPDIEGVHGAAADCTASISCRGLQTCGDTQAQGWMMNTWMMKIIVKSMKSYKIIGATASDDVWWGSQWILNAIRGCKGVKARLLHFGTVGQLLWHILRHVRCQRSTGWSPSWTQLPVLHSSLQLQHHLHLQMAKTFWRSESKDSLWTGSPGSHFGHGCCQ